MKKNFHITVLYIFLLLCLQNEQSIAQQFIIGSKTNVNTSTIVVPVTCKNFIQFPGWQGSINWDNTKLTYASATTVASQLSGTSYNASLSGTTGQLSFIWFDNNANPQTIPDNTVLFNITFNVVPGAIGNTDIVFSNIPTPLVLADASFNAVSGVNYTKGTASLTGLLPIHLLSFAYSKKGNDIGLEWISTSEINFSHFNIQRSIDGNDFTTIGKVAAIGGGNYSYIDNNLPIAPTMYYRLQMVEKDGSYSYSRIVSCQLSVVSTTLAVYPNPVKETLFAQVSNTKAERVTVQITDMQGKVLQQQQVQLQAGSNSLSFAIGNLSKGSYILLIKGETMQQQQFVKE